MYESQFCTELYSKQNISYLLNLEVLVPKKGLATILFMCKNEIKDVIYVLYMLTFEIYCMIKAKQ